MTSTTDTQRIAWQRQALALLGELLERAAMDGLPPVTWTIGQAGCVLSGTVGSFGKGQRRADFTAWRDALGEPDAQYETREMGSVRLRAIWQRVDGVQVTLTATIPDETEGES